MAVRAAAKTDSKERKRTRDDHDDIFEDRINQDIEKVFDELKDFIDDEENDVTAVMAYVRGGNFHLLLPQYINLPGSHWTPLHEACTRGVEFVEALLGLFGPLVNYEADEGMLPIDVAIENEDLASVLALLRAGSMPFSPYEHDEVSREISAALNAHDRFFFTIEAVEPDIKRLKRALETHPFLKDCKKDGLLPLAYAQCTLAGADVLAALEN